MLLASKVASITNMIPNVNPDSIDTNPIHNDLQPVVSADALKSILKPQSLSLEPKDKRNRTKSNTPRKVQFTVVEGQYGGRGQTEFQKTPKRKSHTKKQLPIGIFDTDSNTDTDQTLSDIDENASKTRNNNNNNNYNINDNGFSLLDNLNSKKFMQNSRLVRLVKRKKKRKEKEEKWLTMISPDVGLYSQSKKTASRIPKFTINNINISTTNAINNSNNINNNNNNNNDRFKSPSHYMSRGRRAWYKAQKQMNNKPTVDIDINNNNNNNNNNNGYGPRIVKGTPIVKAVSRIVMRLENQQRVNDGNDGDNDDDDDDIIMNNNGSIPPELITNNVSSELIANNTDKQSEKENENINDDNEMKDNSHQNSPQTVDQQDDDEETQSDEMKVDDDTLNKEQIKNVDDNNNNNNNNDNISINIPFEEDEDDDLILNNLRNANNTNNTSLFIPKSKEDIIKDDMDKNTNHNNNNNDDIDPINSNPMRIEQTSISQQTIQDSEDINDDGMHSKSPSEDLTASKPQQLNFNISASPMRYNNNDNNNHIQSPLLCIPESPEIIKPTKTQSTQSILSMNDNNNNNNNNNNHYIFSRSIGTQTQHIQCEIAIQTGIDNINSFNVNSPFVVMRNKPIIITTSFGSKFIRITEENDNDNDNRSEIKEITISLHEYPMIGPYVMNEGRCDNRKCDGNDKDKNNKYWISTKLTDKYSLCDICMKRLQLNHVNDNNAAQQLQSLSLNIENRENIENIERNVINTRSRSRLKRKFNETMSGNNDENHNKNEQLLLSHNLKRRRVNKQCLYQNNNEKRIKYQKNDTIWTSYKGNNEPAIILNCRYEENERFYPSKYEILWLNWTDTTDENGRKGLCSITIESYQDVKSYVNDKEFDHMFKNDIISINGWEEIKKYRYDIYKKYFDFRDKKTTTKKKKVKKKRRASII